MPGCPPPRFSLLFFSTGTYVTNLDALVRRNIPPCLCGECGVMFLRTPAMSPDVPYTLPRCMLVQFRVSWCRLYSGIPPRTVFPVHLILSLFRGVPGAHRLPSSRSVLYASTSTRDESLFSSRPPCQPTLRPTDNVASRAIPSVFRSTRSFQIRIDSCLLEPSQRKMPDVSGIPQND